MSDTQVIGVTVKEVRAMTKEEMAYEGWDYVTRDVPAVVVLSNGVILYPSADPEGNGPGFLVGKSGNESFYFSV